MQALVNNSMEIVILWVQGIVLSVVVDQVAANCVAVPDVLSLFNLQKWNSVLGVLSQVILLQLILVQEIDVAELVVQTKTLEAQHNSTNWWAELGSVQNKLGHFGLSCFTIQRTSETDAISEDLESFYTKLSKWP